MFNKKIASSLTIILIVCFMIVGSVAQNADVYNSQEVFKILNNTALESLTAKSLILVDSQNGTVIFEKNSQERMPLASITKVMSMLIIMEDIEAGSIGMEDIVETSEYAASMGGSQVYLEVGEKFTVEEMLKAVAIHSSNDCTVALAEKVSGSESTFVDRMNKKAKELGMKNTYFLDCTGLTDEGHYSTAYDISIMCRELVNKHPKILEFTSIWHDTFRNGTFSLDNTNKLVNSYKGLDGLKTGFTTKAGYCLTATAKRDSLRLISVVLGTETTNTRFAETRKLLDFGFANVELYKANTKDEIVKKVDVAKGVETTVNAVYKDDVNLIILKANKNDISREVIFKEDITAPIEKGQSIGIIEYKVGENTIGTQEIVAANEVKKASFIRLFFRMILRWIGIK